MIPVQSSAVEAVDFEPKGRRLTVTYSGGATYAYSGVAPPTWKRLLAAESKGRFVNREIKPNYPAVKVSPD